MKRVTYFLYGVQTRRTIFSFIVIISVRILLYTAIRQQHVLKWPAVLSTSEIHILQGLTLLYTQTHKHTDGALYLLENNVCCPFFLYFIFFFHILSSNRVPSPRPNVYAHVYIIISCVPAIFSYLIVVDSSYCACTYIFFVVDKSLFNSILQS